MDGHIIIIESNGNRTSRLSRNSFSHSHGHSYRAGIRVSVQHCSHVGSELPSLEREKDLEVMTAGVFVPGSLTGGRFAGHREPAARESPETQLRTGPAKTL